MSSSVNILFNGSSLYISVFVAEKHSTLKSSAVATNLFNEYLKENKVGYYISMHDDEIEIRTELPRNIFGGKIRHLYGLISTTSTFNIFPYYTSPSRGVIGKYWNMGRKNTLENTHWFSTITVRLFLCKLFAGLYIMQNVRVIHEDALY